MEIPSASKPPTKRSKLDRQMPWYQWNPTTFQMDRHVQKMTWEERGICRELLDESYLRDGLPAELADIARLLAEDLTKIKPQLDVVLQCFEIGEDGKRRNWIIEEVREEQNRFRRSRAHTSKQVRASASSGAHVHGRDSDTNRESTETETETETKQALGFAVPDWVPSESWAGFVEMRKRSRKPFTDRAAELIVKKLEKLRASGEDVAEVLDQSTRNGWQDVFPLKRVARSAASPHTGFEGKDYSAGLRPNADGTWSPACD